MTEPDLSHFATDTKAIQEGIVRISLSWASIESNMSLLLREILDPSGPGDIAFAIYYTPASAEVRFKIVDAAFCELLGQSSTKDQDAFDALIAPWRSFLQKLNGTKEVRNAVAHGTISTFNRYNKIHVRLTPPLFDFRRILPAIQKRQVPGLSAQDIQTGADKMVEINGKLPLFFAIAQAWHAKDDAALQKAFAAAAASLTTSAPQQAARKQPTRHSQPRPSRAARRRAALDRATKKKP